MNDHLNAPFDLFLQDLQPEESILWTGRPDPAILFTTAGRFLVPFSLLWGGFALFWEGSVIYALLQGETKSGNGGDLRFFAIVGLIFVAFGLYFLFGRFIFKKMHKRRTYYAVTDKRVLALYTRRRRRLDEIPLGNISSITRSDGPRNVGSLQFAKPKRSKSWFGRLTGWFNQRQQQDYGNTGLDLLPGYQSDDWPIAFYDIPDADEVEVLVGRLRSEQARA